VPAWHGAGAPGQSVDGPWRPLKHRACQERRPGSTRPGRARAGLGRAPPACDPRTFPRFARGWQVYRSACDRAETPASGPGGAGRSAPSSVPEALAGRSDRAADRCPGRQCVRCRDRRRPCSAGWRREGAREDQENVLEGARSPGLARALLRDPDHRAPRHRAPRPSGTPTIGHPASASDICQPPE
jgi:hypothetical protein